MRYAEFENAIYRGEGGPGAPLAEVAVGGEWKPAGKLALDAALYGSPLSEEEACKAAGEDWPGEKARAAEPNPE